MSDWKPIEEAIEAAKTNDGWIGPCLFAIERAWGWQIWVGQCDDGDYWLGRDDRGGCWESERPSHYMPLPKPPPKTATP